MQRGLLGIEDERAFTRQYLERVREEHRKADKKTKTRLPTAARRRTWLHRKALIVKLAQPPVL